MNQLFRNCFMGLLGVFTSLASFDSNQFKAKVIEFQNEDSWAFQRIEKELSPWAGNLNQESLNQLIKGELSDPSKLCSLIEVKNNKVSIYSPNKSKINEREIAVVNAVKRIARNIEIPDVSFIISTHDDFNEEYPVFSFAKDKSSISILFPDFEALQGYAELTPKVIQASNKFRWERKINQIFWRGSMTGGSFNLTNYHIFPRSLAVRFSLINPSVLNARFIENGQVDLKTMKEMKKLGYFGNSVPIEKSIAYKYLLDIDGNSCCYSRTYWALLSNSVVIKMRSDNVQWYYDLLKPDINYISVNSDLSDLNQIFNFLNNNDLEAQEMANRATNIAKLELSYEATLAYFYVLLKRFEFYLH